MNAPLTLADFAPAIFAAAFGLMGMASVWYATRGTRALRRARREAAARAAEEPDSASRTDDLARARALADALVQVLRAAERKAPEPRAAE
jgi:hypothetical protein